MPDTREEILARLVAIAAEVPGVATAGRNRIGLSETARPAIVVLDADEAAEEEERASRPGHAPQLLVMTPELFVLAGKPAAEIGAELNAWRRRIVRRVLTDVMLLGLTGSNGFVRYAGCATALAAGRSMEGEMSLSFAIRYILRPTEMEDQIRAENCWKIFMDAFFDHADGNRADRDDAGFRRQPRSAPAGAARRLHAGAAGPGTR